MKEPAKEAENMVFQYLECCQDDDDDIDAPLHRSTPKDKKESSRSQSSRRSHKVERYFQSALAQRDEQLGTFMNAYQGLVVAWKQEDEMSESDKTLEGEATPSRVNWDLESRLSVLSSHSTLLSEGCLDNCEIPEQVLDLIKELAKQLLHCQKAVVSLKAENEKLSRRERDEMNETIKQRETELVAENEAWKESCDESRKEIESLKTTLRNYEEEVKKLQCEKTEITCKLNRLKNNHGVVETDEPLLAACLAQKTHLSQSLNTLKRLNDKQQQVICNLQDSLTTNGFERIRKSTKPKLDTSTSSGRSTLRSLNVSNASINSLAKKPNSPSKKTNPTVQYDESIVKLSRLLIQSNEMLRLVDGTNSDANLGFKT